MADPARNVRPNVAIAGMGATTAVGRGIDALRSALQENSSGLRSSPRFASPRFQSSIVGEAPVEGGSADDADPAFRLANEALHESREQSPSRDLLASLPPSRIALVLSTTKANIEAMERVADGRPCPDAALRHLEGDLLAIDLAAAHGAGGPVQCVSNACVSGLVALQQGAKLIQRDAADAVLVVGVDHLSAFVVAGFTALKAIDPDGCRPFDQDRRGLSPGEAAAAIVLARADRVPAPAITLAGWGGSNDANHMTGPARDGSGLARAIRAALAMANVAPGEIDYVNAHGTGTPYNDAMEAAALRAVFGDRPPPCSGAKGMLGHTLGAAGVVETVLCALAIPQRRLPGTPRLKLPATDAPSSLVAQPRPVARLNHILKLNTGFGGVNGALILRAAHG